MMFDIGSFQSRISDGIGRRAFLQLGAAIPAGLMLGPSRVLHAGDSRRAKSVIFLWMWGAPSHIDTFDPKPGAPSQFRGPFDAISTKQPGVYFSELLPKLAARSDRFSVIRSHVTPPSCHASAGTHGLTGFPESPDPRQPNFGAIVGSCREHNGSMPPFVMVGRGIPRDVNRTIEGYGGGTLGIQADPLLVSCSDEGRVAFLTPQISAGRASHRLSSQQSRKAFDLTQELQTTRDEYGRTTFGQSCLLARRLAEEGVPYIQVNWSENAAWMNPDGDGGWDTHIYNFELLQHTHCPIFDRAFAALLDDLAARNMLDSTLVVAMGEFGRTPLINDRAARDDWNRCYFSLWSGGGVQPGRVIGASDTIAAEAVTDPITPLMVGTTIAELAGVNAAARAELQVLNGGTVIRELL